MDPKKQELNPELKEIYNRVMNTQVKAEPPPPQSAPTEQPTSPPAPTDPTAVSFHSQPGSAQSDSTAVSFHSQPGSFAPAGAGVQSAPFVFTGNKVTTPQAPTLSGTQVHASSSRKISGAVIAGLVAILVVVWGLFWAKFFGLF